MVKLIIEPCIPHARFIEILTYKSLLKDIVVIEVEDSYTSQ